MHGSTQCSFGCLRSCRLCVRCLQSLHAVLALVVPPQVHLPLEAFCADVAAEGLEARVLPAVGDQVGALAEGFAAHLALVGLLT